LISKLQTAWCLETGKLKVENMLNNTCAKKYDNNIGITIDPFISADTSENSKKSIDEQLSATE